MRAAVDSFTHGPQQFHQPDFYVKDIVVRIAQNYCFHKCSVKPSFGFVNCKGVIQLRFRGCVAEGALAVPTHKIQSYPQVL